jgi:hypothetical protein
VPATIVFAPQLAYRFAAEGYTQIKLGGVHRLERGQGVGCGESGCAGQQQGGQQCCLEFQSHTASIGQLPYWKPVVGRGSPSSETPLLVSASRSVQNHSTASG